MSIAVKTYYRSLKVFGTRSVKYYSMATESYLFPEIQPFNSGFLKVSDIHDIYFEECGNPKGKPAVFL